MKIRRILLSLLLLGLLWISAVHAAAAALFGDGIYTFEKTEYDTAIITDCKLTDENINVPEAVLGYPVVGLGNYVFLNNSYVKSVKLPEYVSFIGEFAFAQNAGLESVTIPRNCSQIADNAFFKCPNVTFNCYYGTAAHIYAKEHSIPCVFRDIVTLGDVNADRHISIDDVTAIQLDVAEIESLDGIYLAAADIDQNGSVDINDATMLQMYLAEYDLAFPIGEPIRIDYSQSSAQ